MQNKTKLRVDIEALRGLSVILVILYHFRLENLDFQIIKGGFLGVDIFFVISGYLITLIILDELRTTNSFSFKNFYQRRIRRIIPVFSVVILCFLYGSSMPFCWPLLSFVQENSICAWCLKRLAGSCCCFHSGCVAWLSSCLHCHDERPACFV